MWLTCRPKKMWNNFQFKCSIAISVFSVSQLITGWSDWWWSDDVNTIYMSSLDIGLKLGFLQFFSCVGVCLFTSFRNISIQYKVYGISIFRDQWKLCKSSLPFYYFESQINLVATNNDSKCLASICKYGQYICFTFLQFHVDFPILS